MAISNCECARVGNYSLRTPIPTQQIAISNREDNRVGNYSLRTPIPTQQITQCNARRYGYGYELKIQVKGTDTAPLHEAVSRHFPSAELKEQHAGMCTWQLPPEVCVCVHV